MKFIHFYNRSGDVVAKTKVDDEDYVALSRYRWRVGKSLHLKYAVRGTRDIRGKYTLFRMHREILGLPPHRNGIEADHIDGDTLNNQRSNLRQCSRAQNNSNKGPTKRNKSGYKGVYWYPVSGRWKASIRHQSKTISLGTFDSPEEAFEAYAKKAKELQGAFAHV